MRVIASTLVVLLMAACANVVIDPLGIFFVADIPGLNRYKPEVLNYWRTSLPLRARLVRPEGVVIGSSRALLGIDPADAAFRGAKVYNLSVPGANTCDMRDALAIALAGGKLKQAVIGLDFFTATTRRIGPDCGLREARDHPWRLLAQTVLSSDTLNASVKTVTKQRKVDSALWQPAPDGHAWLHPGFETKTGGARARFMQMEALYARDHYLMPPHCGFVLEQPGADSLHHLRALLDRAHAAGVDVRLFFSPEHARQLAVIEEAGLLPVFEAWMRGVLRVNQEAAAAAGKPPFPVTAHHEAAWVTEALPAPGAHAPMRWMLDGTHYTPAAGQAMLARVMAPPLPLDVGAEMDSLRTLMQRYFAAHPQEREEIRAMVARIKSECRR